MLANLIKKVIASFLGASGIILILYLIAIFSDGNSPIFFFQISLSGLSLFLLIIGIVLLIGKIFDKFNINWGLFTGTFALVNLLVLLITYSKGMSSLYYIVLCLNLFVVLMLFLIIYLSLPKKD